MRPADSGARALNAAGLKSKSYVAQPMHLSTTLTVTDFPPWLILIFFPQLGLPLDWVPISPADMATTNSESELVTPQAPRPTA